VVVAANESGGYFLPKNAFILNIRIIIRIKTMINDEKIGVGIITCNRPDFYKKCYDSIADNPDVDVLVVVNDGEYLPLNDTKPCVYIHNDENLGVAKSKNEALKTLMEYECDHIFLVEDDMYIKNPMIFQKYIEASKISGIQHLMFGYHGPANKNGISGGTPDPKLVVKYTDDISLAFNKHCVGAFCYYSKESISNCGYIDEDFKNAFDHVSHSYTLALKGYSTPYWWWADLSDSLDYIEEQECSTKSSSIVTPENLDNHARNIATSYNLFKTKFGYYPWGDFGVIEAPLDEVCSFLRRKQSCWTSKVLVKFPTRSRPDKFFYALDKYYELAENLDDMVFIITCDIDDVSMNNIDVINRLKKYKNLKVYFGTSTNKIEAVNANIEEGFDVLILASDDMVPVHKGYDVVIRQQMFKYFPDGDGALWFNDGHQGTNINTLPIMGKAYYDRFGYIYHPSYKSVYCDNEYTEVGVSLKKLIYFSNCIIEHVHPAFKPNLWDNLYHTNEQYVKSDEFNYKLRKANNYQ